MAAASERALCDELLKAVTPAESQPGLFDGRELKTLETALTGVAEIERSRDAAIDHLRLAAELEAATPVLEIAFVHTR